MIRHHDMWSKMGEEQLGEHNVRWAKMMEEFPNSPPGAGPMTLLKAILNDYWADVPSTQRHDWDIRYQDMVMSKLYWCWVAWMDSTHLELEEE
jgi:hypothetical protein